ncbi:M16 family metallopeptidase [Abyssalbus ytuae]|uniref:Insulinase family protein n=1 Tax=Abyssalbus ytuae TaxID=2926907 RepID=A0A9E6ZZC3_9FLAO|nr:M16 family metallopeptidase [Abyssalbus ytuae]UOB17947.1 insulinase family protein [Abyssalbus ytuae]
MNRIILYILMVAFSFNTIAQNINLNTPVPVDKTIKKGVLANGMTYYIKSTDVVKEAASYYIIQNVGSILEDDNQQGLAHFLEHMAFNGTQSFPGKGILNILQKHGAVFGKDINAYTSFDETVYNLSNIPTKDGLVDTCLTILNDWSNYLLLTDEEIDAERGVIKEEWRTRQNGKMRLYQTSLPIMYNHSKYSDRMPIGLMSVVENFDYKALRDFYHDWYRTDLQAIAIVGDIDIKKVEQKIIEKFSKIPALENPRERFIIDIPDNDKMLYSLGTDPEISTASISFGIRHKKAIRPETVANLKRSLLESIITSMLNSRISELSQKPDAAFLKAMVGYGSLSRTSNVFKVWVFPKENRQQDAFKQVLTEVKRAVKFGYTQPEIDRAITTIKSSYENKIARKEDMDHKQIESIIQNNYLNNKTMADLEKEYEISKQILSSITQEELLDIIQELYAPQNRYLNVVGVENHNNLTEDQAKQIISEVENDDSIKAYSETLKAGNLISESNIKPGAIVKEIFNPSIGAITFELSNGIKVHYKFVDKEKNKVSLHAHSKGGISLLNDKDLPSSDVFGNLVKMSGLGEFTATDLRKVLAGKTATAGISLNSISENISGFSNTKDVATMLQMIYLYFEKPRLDEEAYKVLLNNIDNYLKRRTSDITEQMKDSLKITLYGKNNPKKRIFDQDYVNDISFEKVEKIYKERFSDASDFEFFIVGDVRKEQLKPLLEKYIAGISTPPTKIVEDFKDKASKWVSSKIDKDIFIKMENPKTSLKMVYKKEIPYSLKASVLTNVLGNILQLRITETIRESEGGAYSPKANAWLSREPKAVAFISISFDCNPDMVDNLSQIIKDELHKIKNGDISDEDLEKVKTSLLKEREQSKDRNSYDMQLLINFYRYNYNMNDPKNFESIVRKITRKDIEKMATKIIVGAMSYEIIFKPLK